MPETPDFDQIARRIATGHNEMDFGGDVHYANDHLTAMIVTQLRQVWNARGAADVEALAPNLHVAEERAIKDLDR